jgi:3-oxoacyl-[acyl-carrier protein] reductase
MSKLAGKVAVVTGASKGIGAGIAKALAAEGAAVVVNYASSKAGADAVVDAITEAGGKALAIQGDVSREAEAKGVVDAALSEYGRLDVLVNNSGVYEFSPIETSTEEQYRKMFDVNVLGTLLTTKAAVPHLGEGASVINISSAVTSLHIPESAIYTGTKGAVDAITGVLAKELGPRKIRVNAVAPGSVPTPGAMGLNSKEEYERRAKTIPLRRLGRESDNDKAVAFLLSREAEFINGAVLQVDGGIAASA